jgi:hypothetical protein
LIYNLRYSLGLGMAVSIIAGGLAFAHHSTAGYDLDHMEELPGTLKQLNWANPHISFIIDTDAKDGPRSGTWAFEASSPGVLTRSGWTKRSIQPGDHAMFTFAPLRDGKPGGILRKVKLDNGTELSYSFAPVE